MMYRLWKLSPVIVSTKKIRKYLTGHLAQTHSTSGKDRIKTDKAYTQYYNNSLYTIVFT